jgi:hypothetical protein
MTIKEEVIQSLDDVKVLTNRIFHFNSYLTNSKLF